MVRGVIFGVEYLILATKTKMLGKQLFLGCMCSCLGALMGPPKDKNGRYVNPRQVLDRLKRRNGWWGHFGGGVPDISLKNKDAGKTVFFGCMCGCFGALMWPPMVGNDRYANPR